MYVLAAGFDDEAQVSVSWRRSAEVVKTVAPCALKGTGAENIRSCAQLWYFATVLYRRRCFAKG